MKKLNLQKILGLSLTLIALEALSITPKANASFFPPNDLHLKKFPSTKAVDQKHAEKILDDILSYFKDAAKQQSAKFKGRILWDDSTVNAVAYENGKKWNVDVYGGLVKYPLLTEDAIATVICHEVGHHIAGYFFKTNFKWASSEGESDYFATQKCAKAIFEKHKYESKPLAANVETKILERCNTLGTTSQETCVRLHRASIVLANILAELGSRKNMPQMDTPSTHKVSRTNTNHPEAQCRLDTLLAGIYCKNAPYPSSIPGRTKLGGRNTKEAELESAKMSCAEYLNDVNGIRPNCWFKPLLGSK